MGQSTIYHDGTYQQNNPGWHEEDSPWKARQIAEILKKNHIVPFTVGEIGCGAGGILKFLAEQYGQAVTLCGYEISPQAFELCREKEAPNLHFFLKDLLAEAQPTFDVSLAIDVLEHVEDYCGFLRKFARTGVYKIFHIPLDLSVQTVLRATPIIQQRITVGHLHYFTKETALATLKDAGYEVVDWRYTSGSSELPNRSWKAKLLKLPRRFLLRFHPDMAARLLGGCSLLVLAK